MLETPSYLQILLILKGLFFQIIIQSVHEEVRIWGASSELLYHREQFDDALKQRSEKDTI